MSETVDKLLSQAAQARREDRHADAKRGLLEALSLCRQANDSMQLAQALAALGQIETDLGHADAALQHYGEAAAIYRNAADRLKLAHTIRHIGDIHRREGQPELAEPFYREALALYRADERTPPLDLANAIRGLAILKHAAAEIEEARALWEEARSLYTVANVKAGVAESSRRLALLASGRVC
ncbi:MAG: tetratricopeptide repeat protein [Candidatus Angelobacter sp.]